MAVCVSQLQASTSCRESRPSCKGPQVGVCMHVGCSKQMQVAHARGITRCAFVQTEFGAFGCYVTHPYFCPRSWRSRSIYKLYIHHCYNICTCSLLHGAYIICMCQPMYVLLHPSIRRYIGIYNHTIEAECPTEILLPWARNINSFISCFWKNWDVASIAS